MIEKEKIKQFLKEIGIDKWVTSLQIVNDEVCIDITSPSPAMHEKKKLEQSFKQSFSDIFGGHIPLKLKIYSPQIPTKQDNKGKAILGVKNIIAIASGKGGVGKSTVAANLAVTLAELDFRVGLLDADIYGPSIPTMFNTERSKPTSSKVGERHLMKPIEVHHVKTLSIGYFSGVEKAVVWRGPMAGKALYQMIRDTDWGELDFLLVDLPPGTGDVHLSLIQEIPVTGVVIVSTPQNIALADVSRGIAMFQMENINIPILGLIENMAYFTPEELPDYKYYIFGKRGAQDLAKKMNISILGEIPIIQGLREASDEGVPGVLKNKEVAKIYQYIAKNIIEKLTERNNTLPQTEAVKITNMTGCSPKKD